MAKLLSSHTVEEWPSRNRLASVLPVIDVGKAKVRQVFGDLLLPRHWDGCEGSSEGNSAESLLPSNDVESADSCVILNDLIAHWCLLQRFLSKAEGDFAAEEQIAAASLRMLQFSKELPEVFRRIWGPVPIEMIDHPLLRAATKHALEVFAAAFAKAGVTPQSASEKAVLFAAALQGIVGAMQSGSMYLQQDQQRLRVVAFARALFRSMLRNA